MDHIGRLAADGAIEGRRPVSNAQGDFVGRQREFDALKAAFARAQLGQGRLVMLAGEPGIGKTRMALELDAHAHESGGQIAWGRCHEDAGAPPYWPWTQVLNAVMARYDDAPLRGALGVGAADIAAVAPDVAVRFPDIEASAELRDPEETRFRLFGSLARFLRNLADRKALVLVLDDLHWADVPSLRLLEFFAEDMATSRLMLLGTYREMELSRRHRLSDTLGSLARVPHFQRLHLSGLTAEDVHRFVSVSIEKPPPVWLTSAIHEQTEGNPLFVREVVRLLAEQNYFATQQLTPGAAIRLPEGVRETIGRRLNRLSPVCNEVLAVASVIGRHFSFDVLARAMREYADEALLAALEEAVAARVIEETGDAHFQFTHTLVRVTLYDELRTGQRRRLHHAVGVAMEAAYQRDLEPVLADLAHHFRASGLADDCERAIGYAIRAGQRADAASAYEDAVGFYQNALDLLETVVEVPNERHANLLLMLGNAERKAGPPDQAQLHLRAAAEAGRLLGLPHLTVEAARAHADCAWRHSSERASRSGELLETALTDLPETEIALRSILLGALARDRLHTGQLEEARVLAGQAISLARQSGDPAALASSLSGGLSDLPWRPEETETALAMVTEMIAAAERGADLETVLHGLFRRAEMLIELGDFSAASATINTMTAVNGRLRQGLFQATETILHATIALMRGELGECERLLGAHLNRSQSVRLGQIIDIATILIFALRREQGRLAELAPLAMAFVQQSHSATLWRPGLALLHLELGDRAAARIAFEEMAAQDLTALPYDGRWMVSMNYLAEVCAALGDASRADVLYRLLLPWQGRNFVNGSGTSCAGSSGRFLGMLAATMCRWDEAERHFEEALAMNARIGARQPLAHTQCDYAVMLLARAAPGDRDRATALLEEAEILARPLGLVAAGRRAAELRLRIPGPGPTDQDGPPDGLTNREMEVLRLLAIGRSNADIGLALGIGQSTVATHIHKILTKTGCDNRTEAAAYATRHGLSGA